VKASPWRPRMRTRSREKLLQVIEARVVFALN